MSTQPKILIIEDDPDISEVLKLQLQLKQYDPIVSGSFHEAQKHFNDEELKLFLIDRMLPDSSGLEICQLLKRHPVHKDTPIILITAMAESENIVEGLDAGADDYITKPFDINILHARVRTQLRRNQVSEEKQFIQFAGLEINIDKCEVKVEDKPISLTNTEFQILTTLARKPGIVHSREKLIHTILGDDIHVTSRTIDTHIAGLRKKIKPFSNLIETIRGVGYRLREDD